MLLRHGGDQKRGDQKCGDQKGIDLKCGDQKGIDLKCWCAHYDVGYYADDDGGSEDLHFLQKGQSLSFLFPPHNHRYCHYWFVDLLSYAFHGMGHCHVENLKPVLMCSVAYWTLVGLVLHYYLQGASCFA